MNAARHAAKEENLEPVHAPTHHLQEEERSAREKLGKEKNAKFNHAKVRWLVTVYYIFLARG